MNEMALKIQALRKEKGMTLEEVASRVGVGKSTVRKWEIGMIENMRRDKIKALADALGTTPEYLMGWDANKPVVLTDDERTIIELYNDMPKAQKTMIKEMMLSVLKANMVKK